MIGVIEFRLSADGSAKMLIYLVGIQNGMSLFIVIVL